MAYRLELLEAGSRSWRDRAMFQADGDTQAIGIARSFASENRSMALWQDRRLVMISRVADPPSPSQ